MSFSRRVTFVGLAAMLAAGPVLARDVTAIPEPSRPTTVRCEQGPVFNSFSRLPDASKKQEVFLNLQRISAKLLSAQQAKQKKNAAGRQTDPLKSAMRELARERKALLLEMMEIDPALALQSAFLSPIQANLHSEIPSCVESSVSLEGTLDVIHIDDFDAQEETNEYILTTKSGERLRLHPAGTFAFPVHSNLPVRLEGFRLDNEVMVDAKRIEKNASGKVGFSLVPEAHAEVPHAFGPQSTAAVIAHFQNATNPVTPTQLSQNLFGQTNAYFQEASYGKMSVVGQTFGPYTLSLNATCDYDAIIPAAIQAADPAVVFKGDTRRVGGVG
jgi:hypothetical protein